MTTGSTGGKGTIGITLSPLIFPVPGGGGGGVGNNSIVANGTTGGKGVVILRMLDSNYSGTTTGSPTVTQNVGGTDTVIVFNDSGSYTG